MYKYLCISPIHFMLKKISQILKYWSPTKSTYHRYFTEEKSSGNISHPYNAITSLIYIYIFIVFMHDESGHKQTVSIINLILGIVSYLFHATEISIIEKVDITFVYANKLAFLLLQLNVSLFVFNMLVMLFLSSMLCNLYINKDSLKQYVGCSHRNYFLVPLTFGILLTLKGSMTPYLVFLVAYVFKFSDIFLSYYDISITQMFQGTAIYHLVTGCAMTMKLLEI